jgi:hypothetical protein
MQDSPGNAMPWWWDSMIDKNQLYFHFGALARFLGDVDRRGSEWKSWHELWPIKGSMGQDERLGFYGLRSSNLILGWICDEKGMNHHDRATPQEYRGLRFYLAKIEAGTYEIEFWDTREGRPIAKKRIEVEADESPLVQLPPFKNDVAFKMKKL